MTSMIGKMFGKKNNGHKDEEKEDAQFKEYLPKVRVHMGRIWDITEKTERIVNPDAKKFSCAKCGNTFTKGFKCENEDPE